MRVAVVGVGAITPCGDGWRELRLATPSARHVSIDPAPLDAAERMARRLMSRSARLAHLAVRSAIADAGWGRGGLADVGVFMGVGASGGSVDQIEAMLAPSLIGGALSWEAFGSAGLRAASPLFAFQLMNNFSMCHAAILAGTRGPNLVLFSRGRATLAALEEAAWAIAEGDCHRALAGAADTALDPVTAAEIARRGDDLTRCGEGAAMLALSADDAGAIAAMTFCDSESVPPLTGVVVDGDEIAAAFGDPLAATPAIACAVALDHVAAGAARSHVVFRGGGVTFEALR